MAVLVGTSGWQYADRRGRFSPQGLPQRLWLEHHAAHWGTVEVNNAFYRLPERTVFETWAARTPEAYVGAAVRDASVLVRLLRERGREAPAGEAGVPSA